MAALARFHYRVVQTVDELLQVHELIGSEQLEHIDIVERTHRGESRECHVAVFLGIQDELPEYSRAVGG